MNKDEWERAYIGDPEEDGFITTHPQLYGGTMNRKSDREAPTSGPTAEWLLETATNIATMVWDKRLAYGDSDKIAVDLMRTMRPDWTMRDQIITRLVEKVGRYLAGNPDLQEESQLDDMMGQLLRLKWEEENGH